MSLFLYGWCRDGSYPKVAQCDGTYEIQTEETAVLQWKIEGDDEGVAPSGGSMEFHCPDSDPDSFFPVSVDFISQNILSQVSVSLRLDTMSLSFFFVLLITRIVSP